MNMIIEQNTNYAYKLKYMDNPTFDKVRGLSTKFYRELPQALQDELFEALNRGIDILDSEPQMTAYLFAFGKMHQAKLNYAFDKLPKEFFEQPEINIIDYGCGQALGTMCYADFLREKGYSQKVKALTLIEPSEICLKRAALHASVFFPGAEIKTVNKKFDYLTKDDIVCSEETPTLHILSNVLDILCFDLERFAEIMKSCLKGIYQLVCVGPYFKDTIKDKRMRSFAEHINSETFYETLDKRELNPEKDWTCTILHCSSIKRNVFEIDSNKVFEEAKSFQENEKKDLNSEYCKELFYKLQVCARFGDKRCQNQLGTWYHKGIGTDKNHNMALEWFFKSAMQGYASACKNIVLIYNLDDVGERGKSFEKVFEFFKNAIKNGDAEDKYFYALCFYYGIGVDVNDEQAFYWFNESAKQGHDKASNAVGVCYFKGEGVNKNIELAIRSFTKAALLGNKTSIKNIIQLFKKNVGIEYFGDEQYDIFVKAAQMGIKTVSHVTQSWLIDYFEDSHGVQYSNDGRRLLATNMYFSPNK
jgi:TPR repeat protein